PTPSGRYSIGSPAHKVPRQAIDCPSREKLAVMRLAISNPDAMGDMILRQPLYAALAGAGHELLLIVQSNTAAVARLVAPSARLLEFPGNPYTMTTGKNKTQLEWLVQQVRAFQPELLVLASYQWTMVEEQLAVAL